METNMSMMSATASTYEFLEPKERIRRYGIECKGPRGDDIIFRAGWRPGGEFIQKLTIRNVSTVVKKFKYKLPKTRYFSMPYPEVIILSPGMSTEVDVIFRPVELEPYDDSIYIKMQEGVGSGGFHVPVKAFIEKLIVTTPFGVDLGYCTTHQDTSIVFYLSNEGEVDAPFRWDIPEPFVLEPMFGVIPRGHKQHIKATIHPLDASVFVSQAVCHIGEGVHAIIPEPVVVTRISAIAKYAYIAVSDPVVDFGEVLSGTPPESTKKEILLRNNSVVPAEFQLIRHDKDRDEVFEVTPKSGVMEPNSEISVIVKFNPLATGSYSLDRYTFITPGNCRTTFTCTGMSVSPKITLFKETFGAPVGATSFHEGAPGNSINFRDLEVGTTSTRVFYLKNDSKRPTNFSIVADPMGVFKISPSQGTLPALCQFFAVTLSFTPSTPINYYRRVFVLLGDGLPLFYDVMGTGFIRAKGEIKEQRPAPLRHAHIQAFRNRSINGLGKLNPDELDKLYDEDAVTGEFFAKVGFTGTRAMSVAALQNPLTRNGDATRTATAAAHEFFIEDSDGSCKEVTLNRTDLDFGFTPYMSTSDPQSVVMTNNTHGKVTVVWQTPRIHSVSPLVSKSLANHSEDDPSSGPAFAVDPPTADISAGASITFKVSFKPMQSSRNFLSQLEAFVTFKNQRTFRLVNDHTMSPPWSLSVSAMGHTFATGQLLAKARLLGNNIRGGKLIFPGCYIGESIYQTITLRNTSNLPATFRFDLGWGGGDHEQGGGSLGSTSQLQLQQQDAFSVKPRMGEVAADDFVLVCIRFSPAALKKYTQVLHCLVNGERNGRLLLEGAGGIPFVHCPDVVSAMNDAPQIHDTLVGVSPPLQQVAPRGFLGSFFLKPTCIGLSSSRKFTLVNGSRLPVKYRVQLSSEANGILSITPLRGLLKGSEEVNLIVSFAPKAITTGFFKLKISTFPVGGRSARVVDARQAGPVNTPELLQNLSVTIVAPSEMSALSFDPHRLSMNVRLVNTEETKDMFLENISDSDLKYQLYYRQDFTADNGALEKTRNVSDLLPLVAYKKLDKNQAQSAQDLADDAHSLCCSAPEGILPARSRTRIPFTFRPSRAGLFEFLVYAKLKAVDTDGRDAAITNEEAALLRAATRDRDSYNADVSVDDIKDLMPLAAVVTGRSTFPTLLFEDIRLNLDSNVLVSEVDQLWRQFTLTELNYDLSMPLTEAEVRINNSSSPDLSLLKHYAFEFTPAVLGTPTQQIFIQLRNHGYLTTSFHIAFPNEKQLELEQWCDETDPSEDRNRIISILEELQCFQLEPRHVTLEPGETATLSLSYNHTSLKYGGIHKVSVMMKLDQGKQYFIDLIGRTLPLPTAAAASSTTSTTLTGRATANSTLNATDLLLRVATGVNNKYHFAPVPIGLVPEDAPLQRMELVNVSAVPAIYEVDHEAIAKLVEENFELPIIRIANGFGEVPALGSIYLDWYFYPLEAKTYELPLTIKYIPVSDTNPSVSTASLLTSSPGTIRRRRGPQSNTGTQFLKITILLPGYDPRTPKPKPHGFKFIGGLPPMTMQVSVPNQVATVSADIVEFGIVPQHCVCHRLVVLRNNLGPDAYLEFSLDDAVHSYMMREGLLSVTPSRGRIEHGSHAVLNFKFTASALPRIFTDCFKITVKEIIRVISKKRKSTATVIFDKIRNAKKKDLKPRESVISRCPEFRRNKLDLSELPEGLVANMPTTMTSAGEVVYFRGDPKDVNAETSAMMEAFLSESKDDFDEDGFGFDDTGIPPPTPMSNASRKQLSTRSEAASQSTAGTSGSTSSKMVETGKVGRINYLSIRLKGEICTVENANYILSRGPDADPTKDFVLPPRPPFITPLSISAFSEADLNMSLRIVDKPRETRGSVSGSSAAAPKAAISRSSSARSMTKNDLNINRNNSEVSKSVTIAGRERSPSPVVQRTGSSASTLGKTSPNTSPSRGGVSLNTARIALINSRSSDLNAAAGGGGGGSGGSNTARKLKKNIGIEKKREAEVRDVTEFIIGDLFSDILKLPPMEEYIQGVLEMAPSKEGLTWKDDMVVPPDGSPVVGVYFPELADTLPVYSKFIRELKHMGYESRSHVLPSFVVDVKDSELPLIHKDSTSKGVIIESSMLRKSIDAGATRSSYSKGINSHKNVDPLTQHSVSNIASQVSRSFAAKDEIVLDNFSVDTTIGLGKGTARRTAVVDGVPAPWVLGDDCAMVADETHYRLEGGVLLEAVERLGFLQGSDEYKAFEAELVDRARKAKKPSYHSMEFPVISIIKALKPVIVEELNITLTKITHRRRVERKQAQRRQEITEAEEEEQQKVQGGTTEILANNGGAVDGLVSSLNGLSLTKNTKKPSLTISTDMPLPLPPSASQLILLSPTSPTHRKRVKRSEQVGVGLSGVKSLAEEALDAELHAAMLGDGFLEMATEIMRNTMLNILQEATYGEYTLLAEPVRFLLKD